MSANSKGSRGVSLRCAINLIESLLHEAASQIDGLPKDTVISGHGLDRLLRRGDGQVFKATAHPGAKPDSYLVHLHPAKLGNAQPYQQSQWRPKTTYYDPDLADLETVDRDEPYLERTYARAKPHLMTDIQGLDRPGVMYRGMSYEEYANFLKSGVIQSEGSYNFDNQNGLTYWSTDVRAASSYANGFAPQEFKPTIGHPCFVVAAKMPPASDIRHVKGVAEHEVGVTRAITDNEVLAVWEGKVYDHVADPYDLRPVDNYDYMDQAVANGDTHRVRYGGYSAGVVWFRIR